MQVRTEKKALGFYRGTVTIPLSSFDSPYRTPYMGAQRNVVAWGRSPFTTAERVRDKAKLIEADDRAWAAKKRARIEYVPVDD